MRLKLPVRLRLTVGLAWLSNHLWLWSFALLLLVWQRHGGEPPGLDSAWGLFSLQLYHHTIAHLLLNLGGLLLLVVIAPWLFVSIAWLIQLLLCGWLSNALYLLMNGPAITPLGLSGALHGLAWLVAMALFGYSQPMHRYIALALAALLMAKLAFEQLVGSMPSSQWLGLDVLIDAHLYGVVAALWVRMLYRLARRHRTHSARTRANPWFDHAPPPTPGK